MNINEIIEQIEASFSKAEFSSDKNIIYDNSGNHLECNDIKQVFENKQWNNISFEIIIANESSLSFMSDAGFCYYLPIFMIECIRNYDKYDVLTDNIVYHLTLPIEVDVQISANNIKENFKKKIDVKIYLSNALNSSNQKTHSFIKRMSSFNLKQKQAIFQFLKYLETNKSEDFLSNELTIAIYRYWFQYK